jgi:hypothetical protein
MIRLPASPKILCRLDTITAAFLASLAILEDPLNQRQRLRALFKVREMVRYEDKQFHLEFVPNGSYVGQRDRRIRDPCLE